MKAHAEEGILATVDAMLSAYRSPVLADLPPLHGGLVGYLGYDVVREVEHLPNVPRDDVGLPDSVLHVIGQLCAFDHWRQRVVLVDNVVVGEGWSDAEASAAFDEAGSRLDELAADLSRPLGGPPLEAPRRDDVMPEVTGTMSSEEFQHAVLVAKEHIRAGDIFQVVLSQRFDLDLGADPFDRVPGVATGEPKSVPLLPAHPSTAPSWERRPSRWCACATGWWCRAPSPARAAVDTPKPRTTAWRVSSPSTPRR